MSEQVATQDTRHAAHVLATHIHDAVSGCETLPPSVCRIMVTALAPILDGFSDHDESDDPFVSLQAIHDVLLCADDIGLDEGAKAGPFLLLLGHAAASARDALESAQTSALPGHQGIAA